MKAHEALREVLRLFAAFPSKLITDATAKAYAEQLVDRRSPEALHDAVNSLIRSERWLPPVSLVLEEYSRHVSQYAPREIEERSELTLQEKQENARRSKALMLHLRQGEGHSVAISECEHPDCRWANSSSE